MFFGLNPQFLDETVADKYLTTRHKKTLSQEKAKFDPFSKEKNKAKLVLKLNTLVFGIGGQNITCSALCCLTFDLTQTSWSYVDLYRDTDRQAQNVDTGLLFFSNLFRYKKGKIVSFFSVECFFRAVRSGTSRQRFYLKFRDFTPNMWRIIK